MSRIFASLSLLAILLMAMTLLLGLTVELNDTVAEWLASDNRVRDLEQSERDTATQIELTEELSRREQIQSRVATERGRASVHLLLGVGSALTVVLVSSIAVTYFIGTSRWCREVVETYSLEKELIERGQSLKRRSFPWALVSMLTVVAITALGAASDPGTGNIHSAWWAVPHLITALVGITIITTCFFVLWSNILANSELIETVMGRVKDVRVERSADV